MHPNPVYRHANADQNLEFARAQSFGILAISTEGAPLISHIPFRISDDSDWVEFHLVRSNPIAQALKQPRSAKMIVQGPHSYISPDWYGVEDQVPTWNYVAVHLSGQAELLEEKRLHGILHDLSEHFESRLLPKPIWRSDKMTDGVMERMMRQIVPARMRITQIEGTWKLNQNKTDEVRLSAADNVADHGMGSEVDILAHMMREPPMPQ